MQVGRWSSCRSPTRRPGPATSPGETARRDPVDRAHRGRRPAPQRAANDPRWPTKRASRSVAGSGRAQPRFTSCRDWAPPGSTGGPSVAAPAVAGAAGRCGIGRTPEAQRGANAASRWHVVEPGRGAGDEASRPAPGWSTSGNASSSGLRVGVLRVPGTGSAMVPCSTTTPPYMTTTRSQTSATTPRSWVTRMSAHPQVPAAGRRSSSRIWAWIITSRAVVGSSATMTSGPQARARAIIARWRMPPEILVRVVPRPSPHRCPPVQELAGLPFGRLRHRPPRSCRRMASAIWSAHRLDRVEGVHGALEDHRAAGVQRNWRSSSGVSDSRSSPSKHGLAADDGPPGRQQAQERRAWRWSCRSRTPPPARASSPRARSKLHLVHGAHRRRGRVEAPRSGSGWTGAARSGWG